MRPRPIPPSNRAAAAGGAATPLPGGGTFNGSLSETGDIAPNRHTRRCGGSMSEVVLIVDDDPVQRRLLEAMVQRFGYHAMLAEGGDAAVSLLTGPTPARIDCVVLDLVMPDLDGLGVLARMREAGCDIPVIVQTAHGGIDTVVSVSYTHLRAH